MSCPGCGLANYEGLCAVCGGDEPRARAEGLPYPWPDEEIILSDGFPGGFPSDYLVEMLYRKEREEQLERERKETPERYDSRALCFACGKQVGDHPLDPTFLDYNGDPFVHLLCDGQRAKT